MDFNVNPLCAVACQYINGVLYGFDEIYLTGKSRNTDEMADEIVRRYGKGWGIVPDSTGRALKTSSGGKSDHDILRGKDFKILGGHNPFRVDRYNTVNRMLEKEKLILSPKCKKTIRDLEQIVYKEGTTLPDTANKQIGHIADALGYVCWYVDPIVKPQNNLGMIER